MHFDYGVLSRKSTGNIWAQFPTEAYLLHNNIALFAYFIIFIMNPSFCDINIPILDIKKNIKYICTGLYVFIRGVYVNIQNICMKYLQIKQTWKMFKKLKYMCVHWITLFVLLKYFLKYKKWKLFFFQFYKISKFY